MPSEQARYQLTIAEHPVTYGILMNPADIGVDRDVQRTLDPTRSRKIAINLQRDAVGTLVISQRADGTTHCVDGMHRLDAMLHPEARITIDKVACEVHHGLTREDEARLFLIKNRESRKPNALDEYVIGLAGNIPLYVDTQAVLEAQGLTMSRSTSATSVGAVNGVLRIVNVYGPEMLTRVLRLAAEAWRPDEKTYDGMLLSGLARFLGDYPEVKDAAIKTVLNRYNASHWVRKVNDLSSANHTHGTGTGGRSAAMHELLFLEFNKWRRNKLPERR